LTGYIGEQNWNWVFSQQNQSEDGGKKHNYIIREVNEKWLKTIQAYKTSLLEKHVFKGWKEKTECTKNRLLLWYLKSILKSTFIFVKLFALQNQCWRAKSYESSQQDKYLLMVPWCLKLTSESLIHFTE